MRRLFAAGIALLFTILSLPSQANHVQTDSGRIIVFDHKTGNEWWVEVVLSGQDSGAVATVEAQDTDGAWTPLSKRSWGAWANSFHIEPGHDVRFRATWAGGAVATSCWFEHPSGAERCDAPPTFEASLIGDAGRSHGSTDILVGDGDGDGTSELYVPAPTGLYAFHKVGDAWQRTTVMSSSASFRFDHVAVGDVSGDGRPDLFSSGFDSTAWQTVVTWHHWDATGGVWTSAEIHRLSGVGVGALAIGDVADDGRLDLYVGTSHHFAGTEDGHHPVLEMTYNVVAGWTVSQTGDIPGGVSHMMVADADRDGDQELYLGTREGVDDVWRIDRDVTGWVAAKQFNNFDFEGPVRGLVAGDGDRDGLDELYVAGGSGVNGGGINRFSPRTGGWIGYRPMAVADTPSDLALGDADGDGSKEIYMSTTSGKLYQMRWNGVAFHVTQQAMLETGEQLADLAIGDADNDGKSEAYASAFDFSTCCPPHNIYRIAKEGTPTPPPPPPPPPQFDATFTLVKGNEWWVQTQVTAPSGQRISGVDVRFNGAAWQPLTLQSWGVNDWAKSFHIPQGTIVQFRATSDAGAVDTSSCYRWIPAQGQEAPNAACTGSQPFDANFVYVKGNEWWVEAKVSGNEPIAKVEARINCNGWIALSLRDWGAWASSFHVPNGAKVDIRATSTSGATEVSGGYIWPNATPTTACPP